VAVGYVTMPNNPVANLTEYELRHLAAHLEAAGRDEDLHHLLALEIGEGKNAWYQVKDAIGDIQGYQTDLDRAWVKAETERDIPQQIQYALCQSSLVSIATHYSPKLLALALQHQLLTPQQALSIASRIYYEMRPEVLLEILPFLSDQLLVEALASVQSIEDEKTRAQMLLDLVEQYPTIFEKEEVLTETLKLARGIENKETRAGVLAGMTPVLPEVLQPGILHEALEATWTREDDSTLASISKSPTHMLISPLKKIDLNDTLRAVEHINDEKWRTRVLKGLTKNLPLMFQEECLEIANSTRCFETRTWILTKITPYLRGRALQDALTSGKSINRGVVAKVLLSLARYLPEAMQRKILQYVLGLVEANFTQQQKGSESSVYNSPLKFLVKYSLNRVFQYRWLNSLQKRVIQGNLQAAQLIEDVRPQDMLLVDLIPYLPKNLQSEYLQDMLEKARPKNPENITSMDMRGRRHVLAALIVPLPEVLWNEGCRHISKLYNEPFANPSPSLEQNQFLKLRIYSVLGAVTPHIPITPMWSVIWDYYQPLRYRYNKTEKPFSEFMLIEAMRFVLWNQDEEVRTIILRKLAPYLSDALTMAIALATVRTIQNEYERSEILIGLAPHLSTSLQENTLKEALEIIEWGGTRIVNDLSDSVLLNKATTSYQTILQEEALEIIQSSKNPQIRATTLTHMAPYLSKSLGRKAIEIAQSCEPDMRAKVLTALTPSLPKGLQVEIAESNLILIRSIDSDVTRARLLTKLAPYLTGTQQIGVLHDAVATARKLKDTSECVEALTNLLSILPAKLRTNTVQDTLALARSIGSHSDRANALIGLTSYLSDPLQKVKVLQESLTAAQTIEDVSDRTKILLNILPHLPQVLQQTVLQQVLKSAQTTKVIWDQEDVLADLILQLPQALPDEILPEAMQVALEMAVDTEGIAYPVNEGRSRLVHALIVHLVALSHQKPDVAYFVWKTTLRQLSIRPRPFFLYILDDLIPFVLSLTHEKEVAATEIFHVIQTVTQWWS